LKFIFVFIFRCSILYCFQSYIYQNESAKKEIIESLLASTAASQLHSSVANVLCLGLFNQTDFGSNWLCGCAFIHILSNDSNDNTVSSLKGQLLRAQLSLGSNLAPISLMQQLIKILIESTTNSNQAAAPTAVATQTQSPPRYKFQTTVSILMFLATWLNNSTVAVNYFLSQQENIPYLISQVSSTDTDDRSLIIQGLASFLLGLCLIYNQNEVETFTVDKLKDTIRKRIGIEQFQDKLEFISLYESYIKTMKDPTFPFKSIEKENLIFDYEYTRIFKANEFKIIDTLTSTTNPNPNNNTNSINDNQTALIQQYNNIIREQDEKLNEQFNANQQLSIACNQLQQHYSQLSQQYGSLEEAHLQLKDEINTTSSTNNERIQLQARINDLELKYSLLEEKCSQQEDELCRLQREKGISSEMIKNLKSNNDPQGSIYIIADLQTQLDDLKQQLESVNEEQDNLLLLLQEMETKKKNYKYLLINKYSHHFEDDDEDEEEEEEDDDDDDDDDDDNQSLITNNSEISNHNKVDKVTTTKNDISVTPLLTTNDTFSFKTNSQNDSNSFYFDNNNQQTTTNGSIQNYFN
jgi:hypothetical protein